MGSPWLDLGGCKGGEKAKVIRIIYIIMTLYYREREKKKNNGNLGWGPLDGSLTDSKNT